MATVYGTNNSETIDWWDGVTSGADTIFGYGGNDNIWGLGGADTIFGGDGSDNIIAGSGNDLVKGGAGADYIDGGSGIDTAEYSDSSAGVTVSLESGTGSGGTAQGDTLVEIENLTGSSHADFLIGDNGNNVLTGLGGNDTLKGGGGADTLYGDSGNDTLKGGGGADTLNGGSGIDTADYFDSSAGVSISLITDAANGGDATGDELNSIENVNGSAHDDVLIGDNGVNVLNGRDGEDLLKGYGGNDTIYGGDDSDTLYGMDGNDILRGDNGNDTIYGGNGDDTIYGGAGADLLDGGAGADTYYVDASDVIVDNSAATYDVAITSVSYELNSGANVELVKTTSDAGTAAINLTGNETSQEVRGNAGANTLNGAAGNDLLVGLGGADIFLFDSTLDGSYNVDTIDDFNQAEDFIALDLSIFTGLATEAGHYLTGTEFHTGSAAADADDRIIYDDTTGALFYDSDGTGGAAQVQFATLDPGMALVNDDFIVV